ncbi:MAG: Asp-tRNA(Asn)/Glu-tRNA(Gln) amidotransferase subunit GatC [Steroidobacteraceae bacterium]
MTLQRDDIERIAALAKLSLTPAELPAYLESLPKIVEFVGQLEAADTGDVEPMAHPLEGQSQRLDVDAVTESDQHERYQRNAPAVSAGLYLVPKVIE